MQIQSPAHPFPFHQVQPQSSDYELKRRYLALLSPQQVIEICLTFDVHVPPYIRTTIWPVDLNAAIGAMQGRENSQQDTPQTNGSKPPNDEKKDSLPIMDSLLGPLDERHEAKTPRESAPVSPNPPRSEPPVPDKSPPLPQPTNPTPSETAPTAASSHPLSASPVSATPAPSSPAVPHPQSAASVPPRPPQSGYTHQPYGFAGQSPYPFAPYYPQQWGAYPHIRYPFPSGVPYPAPHLQGFPPAVAPSVSKAPVVSLPRVPVADANADDLPSYEDMIVEILSGLGEESEGLAPKDLWTWMASRFPVQSNFRPSAGQALQKAFKKGRFEKSESGRYRLNSEWKGGGAARKGTRRPQLQSGRGTSQGRPPPFTNAPLVRGPSAFTSTSSTNGQPQQMFGYSNYAPLSSARAAAAPESQSSASGPATEEGTGDMGDVFEAAQHILKAINFGGLLQTNEETETARVADANVAVDTNSFLRGDNRDENVRGELQAQLAVLVVQLGEILQEQDLVRDEREGETRGDDETELSSTSRNGVQSVEETEGKPDMEMEDSDSDADMEFVIV